VGSRLWINGTYLWINGPFWGEGLGVWRFCFKNRPIFSERLFFLFSVFFVVFCLHSLSFGSQVFFLLIAYIYHLFLLFTDTTTTTYLYLLINKVKVPL